MAQKKHITAFMFDYAQYQVGDAWGSRALLKINYAANTYEIQRLDAAISAEFRRDLAAVATDLLARKHGVNFVDRVV